MQPNALIALRAAAGGRRCLASKQRLRLQLHECGLFVALRTLEALSMRAVLSLLLGCASLFARGASNREGYSETWVTLFKACVAHFYSGEELTCARATNGTKSDVLFGSQIPHAESS